MKVRNVLVAAAAAALFGLASVASADKLVTPPNMSFFTDYAASGANGGGEFWFKPDLESSPPGKLDVSAYKDTVTKNLKTWGSSGPAYAGTFQTFCAELTENVGVGTPYQVVISSTSTTNSTDGSGSHSIKGSAGGVGVDLSSKVAYLYYHFVKGDLTGYSYTTGVGRQNSATDLQLAIWDLMGYAVSLTPGATTFKTLPTGAWSGLGETVIEGVDLIEYKVHVLNLWEKSVLLVGSNGQIGAAATGLIVPGYQDAGGYHQYGESHWGGLQQDQLWVERIVKAEGYVPLPATVWSAGSLLGLLVLGRVRRMVSNA